MKITGRRAYLDDLRQTRVRRGGAQGLAREVGSAVVADAALAQGHHLGVHGARAGLAPRAMTDARKISPSRAQSPSLGRAESLEGKTRFRKKLAPSAPPVNKNAHPPLAPPVQIAFLLRRGAPWRRTPWRRPPRARRRPSRPCPRPPSRCWARRRRPSRGCRRLGTRTPRTRAS